MSRSLVYGSAAVALLLVLVLFPSILAPQDPLALDVRNRLQAPSAAHFFGTDEGGRDLYTRVVYGARYTLGMAVAIVLGAAALGTLVGMVSGFVGGRLDSLLMRVVDLFLAFPYFILAMAIASAMGRGAISAIVALVIVWWPTYARMVRGTVLSLKENLFIESARALGTRPHQILLWHVFPHLLRDLNVRITLDIGYAVLALTGLSFLGLGLQNPTPEWGLLVASARPYVLSAWWYAAFPGAVIFAAVLVFTVLGDAFFDALELGGVRR